MGESQFHRGVMESLEKKDAFGEVFMATEMRLVYILKRSMERELLHFNEHLVGYC